MTVMRRELREMLQWCLAQPRKFKSVDVEKHMGIHRTTTGHNLRRLESLGLIEREVVPQKAHYFKVINREKAMALAETPSPTGHLKSQVERKKVYKPRPIGRVNSVWQLGQQPAQ